MDVSEEMTKAKSGLSGTYPFLEISVTCDMFLVRFPIGKTLRITSMAEATERGGRRKSTLRRKSSD
jgi:hypothetical protein